ncbi:ATP/GTP-binding protein [Streptomyces sp. CBMA152]|uniref:ATP/GTP-binding protein n=1 Tax=Streptomyces sp. CBMA152 TaxID=1896312 RepID=UPI0016614786|nr:ATP/GTP-binding protein [Streptomyces sp. CBMA152]MBD0742880.1 ATP/GTP-binding protein [Streptomyces sp. CBMA152]
MSSRADLRALFRSNDRELRAVDFFADRRDEWVTVASSLVRHIRWVNDPAFDVQDLETPRRNVLVFYGVGGIGKSTLSRGVAEHLVDGAAHGANWPPLDPQVGPVIPVRVDLARDAGTDFEALILALRLAVAELGVPMPTFDLAFQRYWERNHPGEPIEEYLRRRTWFSRFPATRSMPRQMQSALSDVAQALQLPGTAGALVGQGLRAVVRGLREHRRQVRALADCRRLADLLEADPDLEALSYYAHLLAWDLSRVSARNRAVLVVLLDTFEDVGSRVHRDLERLIQRVVWLMPNALFIITGRNRLPWDDPQLEGQLDWAGPQYWPLLAGGSEEDPRQHPVGYLSAGDCETYLCHRLTLGGSPLIDDRTRRLITANSHGLPLYLDLAVMRFLDLYRRDGRAPEPTDFNLDFPALVARTFRDLTADVRRVLRAVSLLDSFSVELATASAGLDHDAPALDLVERPFVDSDHGAPWPYRLHDLVRDAVREADCTSEDRWSAADWQRAARRTFDALGSQTTGERQRLVAALRQGLRLARDYRLDLAWLADAAFRYVDDFVWEPIELPPAAGTDPQTPQAPPGIDSPAEALAVTLSVIARRQRRHRGETAEQLRTVLASGQLPAELLELPRYFLAECDRDLGHFDASLEGMRQVAEAGGHLAPTAARGLVHLARRIGRFGHVRTAAEALGPEGRRDRVLGDLWWTQGSMGLACSAYAAARDEALRAGQPGEAALSQACLAYAAAFQDRPRSAEQIARAEDMLAGVSIRWAEVQNDIAALIRDAGVASDLPERADDLLARARAAGLTSSIAYVRLAVCLHAAVLGHPDQLDDARARLRTCVRGEEFAYLAELSYLMADEEPPADLPRAQWLDGRPQVRARWTAVVQDRRREAAARAVRGE